MQDYSFASTSLLINGREMSGYDEGDDTIKLARLNDSATHKVGCDGEMIMSVSADRSGEIIWRLLPHSADNLYLSALVMGMENAAFVPIFAQFVDLRGNDIVSGTQGYLKRPADLTAGKNATNKEWSVVIERLDILHGGG